MRRTWLSGKPGSPGIAKLLSNAMFWTSFCASLSQHTHQPNPPVIIPSHPPSSPRPVPPQPHPPQDSRDRINKPSTHPRPHLPQTLTHEQNPINQQSIRRTLDFEIPKKRIRPKQTQHFIQRIVALAIRLGALRCGDLRRVQRGKSVCGPAGACAQGEEREVPNEAHVGLGVED